MRTGPRILIQRSGARQQYTPERCGALALPALDDERLPGAVARALTATSPAAPVRVRAAVGERSMVTPFCVRSEIA